MTVQDLLAIRGRQRSDLLGRIVEGLKADSRVRAAWLHGSSSRGEDDALSDLDIWVVVSDGAADDFIRNRRTHAAQPAQPILVLEALQNAPPEGAYLLAFYPGEAGPLHVDWFWQPESRARIPDDLDPLFDHAGLSVIPGAQWRGEAHRPPGQALGPRATRSDILTHKITYFWAMSLIVAKYMARRNGETVTRMTKAIATSLAEIADLLDINPSLPGRDAALRSAIDSAAPAEQFEILYRLTRDATGLHKELAAQGAAIPLDAIPHIRRFYELTESMATAPV